jgi:osmotically inducible protein OsmC
MALSGALERNGTPPTRVETKASCTMEKVGEQFAITSMRLDVSATVPGVDDATFQKLAEQMKEGCIVSRALKGNVKYELQATLS